MADRDVTLHLRFDGSEAARGFQDVGNKAEEAARKAQALQAAMGRAEQGIVGGSVDPFAAQAAYKRLGRDVDRARLAAAEEFLDPDRAIRGGMSEAERHAIAAQRNRVRLEEQLRRDQERLEARQRREFERSDPAFLAQRRLERQQLREQVQQQLDILDPEAAAERQAREAARAARYRNPLAGTGFARIATPLFLAHAGAMAAQGVGQGFADVSASGADVSYAQSLSMIGRRMAEDIPIVSGFVRGLENLGDALTGTTMRLQAAASFLEAGTRQAGTAAHTMSLMTRGGREVTAFDQELTGRQTSAAAARAALAGLNPALISSFYTEDVFGVSTRQTGPLRFAAYQAEAARNAARDRAGLMSWDVEAAEEELTRRQGTVTGFRDRMLAAQSQATAMELRARGRGFGDLFRLGLRNPGALMASGALLFGQPAGLAGAQADAGVQAKALAGAEGAVAEQAEIVKDQNRRMQEARDKAAQAEADFQKAKLFADQQNRLDVVNQQVAAMRGGAVSAALAQPGQTQQLLQMARQAQASGIMTIPPEFREQLLSFPVTRAATEKQLREAGLAMPEVQELGRMQGMDIGALQGEQEKLRGAVTTGLVGIQANLTAEFERNLGDVRERFVSALMAAIRAEVGRAAADLQNRMADQQLEKPKQRQ